MTTHSRIPPARPSPSWRKHWAARPKFIPAARPVPVYLAAGLLLWLATCGVLLALGRPIVSPDVPTRFWDGTVGGPGNSQAFLDWYSLLHVVFGLFCAAVLWKTSRPWPLGWLLVAALLAAAGWEVAENTPFVIARFGSSGADPSYAGDSILNATGDMICVVLGCALALRAGFWPALVLGLAIEAALAFIIHDSLAIGAVMLVHPLEAVQAWRMAG
jgi:hypothetical protein